MQGCANRLAEWAALTGEELPDSLSEGRDEGDVDAFEEFDLL